MYKVSLRYSLFLAFSSRLIVLTNFRGLRASYICGSACISEKFETLGQWRTPGLWHHYQTKRFNTISLRGGTEDGDRSEIHHPVSHDNFTTNAVEQADAARLKSAMSAGPSERDADTSDAAGALDNFTTVEISPSGVFKYVLIEATDKQVCEDPSCAFQVRRPR